MGTLVFDVSGGTPDDFVFTLEEAPAEAGLTLPKVMSHTADGTSWRLEGKYPVGQYKVSVRDQCYEAKLEFNIPEFNDFPVPSEWYDWNFNSFKGRPEKYDCNVTRFTGLHNNSSQTTQITLDSIAAGAYEVGFAEVGEEVPEGNWQTYVNSNDVIIRLPDHASKYYTSKTKRLNFVFRMKNCHSIQKRYPQEISIRNPHFHSHYQNYNDCFTYKNKFRVYAGHNEMFCYPMTLNYHRGSSENDPIEQSIVIDSLDEAAQEEAILRYDQAYHIQVIDANGEVVQKINNFWYSPNYLSASDECGLARLTTNTSPFASCYPLIAEWRDKTEQTVLHIDNNVTSSPITLPNLVPYNHTYELTLKQQDGTIVQKKETHPSFWPIHHSHTIRSCNGYKEMRYFHQNYVKDTCFPLKVEWRKKDTQEVVAEKTYNKLVMFVSPLLNFGERYEVRLKNMNDQVLHTYEIHNNYPGDIKVRGRSENPYATYHANKKEFGYIYMWTENSWPHRWEKLKVEVLDPTGKSVYLRDYSEKVAKYDTTRWEVNSEYHYDIHLGSSYWKKGVYTINYYCDGQLFKTDQYEHKGFWNTKDLAYTYRHTCDGIKIQPQGMVTHGEEDKPSDTYFKIIAGPSNNYSKDAVRMGEELYAGSPGRYLIGVLVSNSANYEPIDTIVANVAAYSIVLSNAHTLGYACSDNVTDTGHLFVKATGGVAPYSYELWTEDNTTNTQQVPVIDPVTGVAHWEYGRVGDKFVIHVRDACGTNFEQKITINDLTRINIASTPDKLNCTGEAIVLRCLPLTRYEWYDPQGRLFSKEQNPILTNVKRSMSGLYRVKAFPEGCGRSIEGYVNLFIEPCWAPVNPNLMHKPGSLKKSVPD